ncbi:unnamed protein product, partial [Rotaria magnacalcarata]
MDEDDQFFIDDNSEDAEEEGSD